MTPAHEGEALDDPNRWVLDPDPASESGLSVRIIGYSCTLHALLTVIVLADDGVEYGVQVRLTEEEYGALEWAARDVGLPISTVARQLLIGGQTIGEAVARAVVERLANEGFVSSGR